MPDHAARNAKRIKGEESLLYSPSQPIFIRSVFHRLNASNSQKCTGLPSPLSNPHLAFPITRNSPCLQRRYRSRRCTLSRPRTCQIATADLRSAVTAVGAGIMLLTALSGREWNQILYVRIFVSVEWSSSCSLFRTHSLYYFTIPIMLCRFEILAFSVYYALDLVFV
ncbi:hypothetical protein DFJ43DRAFT_1106428 [Lentinula guzmanii]|uniref:Uncharacterized protein n=1 Tax=Lentinula guzmanii TaxID=2804957 RepID=A0AA38MUI5_9AGAR|nr:hypothetical protein DFJ43DRAFT_1106428 [Lentinula guzmanii]